MSIRLLEGVQNVGVAGATVSLTADFEARLVSSNKAVYSAGRAPVSRSGVPVLSEFNEVTRRIKSSVGDVDFGSVITANTPHLPNLARPVFCSFGDSINGQDNPADLFGSPGGVSPMFWANALLLNAFDLIDCSKTISITPSAGAQTPTGTYRAGVFGLTGALVTQAQRYSIDQYLANLAIDAPGRVCYIKMSGAINDLGNVDTAGYDAVIWPVMQEIAEKIVAAGHVPILKCGESAAAINTAIKRRNQAAMRDRTLAYAAAKGLPCLDVGAAIRKYAKGMMLERLTRGTTGDRTHPNSVLAPIYGLGYADEVAKYVTTVPKFGRADFAGTILTTNPWMLGTAGTKGTNADALSQVPDSWTLAAQTNTVAKSTNAEYDESGSCSFVEITTPGNPTGGGVGLQSGAPWDANVTRLHQAFLDLTVVQCDYSDIGFKLRRDGTNYTQIPLTSSTDARNQTSDYPSGYSLFAGRRLVMSSFPAAMPASTQGSLWNIGGGNGLGDNLGRVRSFVRFAGLVQYNDPAVGYVP